MKKIRRLMALAAACAVLSGCSLLERSYGAVEAHSRKYWESEAETTLRADNYQDMVNDLLILVGQHTESAVIRLYEYNDDMTVAETLDAAATEVQQETAMGSYAVEYITASSQALRGYYEISVSIRYRRTAQQVQNVVNATSVAAATLRAELTLPIIGMEPALKPASQLRHGGRVLVMATPLTLRLPKFQALMARYGEGAQPLPCPGLMELVEEGELDGPEVEDYLARLLEPYLNASLDAVVLGCTHYVFLRPALRRMLPPETALLDGNAGTVRQLHRVLEQRGLLRATQCPGRVELYTSGDPDTVLPQMQRLLDLPDMDETAR